MENKPQIPIYRAKKIDSDEYVEGYYIFDKGNAKHFMTQENFTFSTFSGAYSISRIDPSTLAIHFPDMIDSEKTRIFASLSEDGKGGDEVELSHYVQWSDEKVTETARYKRGLYHCFFHERFKAKVTGIQE